MKVSFLFPRNVHIYTTLHAMYIMYSINWYMIVLYIYDLQKYYWILNKKWKKTPFYAKNNDH